MRKTSALIAARRWTTQRGRNNLTREDLKKIYYKNKDISRLQERITAIEAAITRVTQRISPAPAKSTGEKKLREEYIDLKAILKKMQESMEYDVLTAEYYINSLADPLLRQILTYRYIKLMSWVEVAEEVGGGNTADSVKKIEQRFFKE